MTKRKTTKEMLQEMTAKEEAPTEKMGLTKKEKSRQRTKNRLVVDLPEGFKAEIAEIASGLDCTISSLSGFLLLDALERLYDGKINPRKHLAPIKSLVAQFEVTYDYQPKQKE